MKLLNLLFPPKCVLCRRVLERGEMDLCGDCLSDPPEFVKAHGKLPFLKSWTAIWHYEGNARDSILRFKFHGYRSYVNLYAKELAVLLRREHPEGLDVLTWVPISFLRRLKRGFDQVELLAQAVGRELGMEPVQLLKKIRHNRPQSRIVGQAKRRANVLGAYQVINPEMVGGKRILLLDDIITTGATAGECARMLLTAGAKEVHCGAVAAARHDSKTK